MTMITVRTLQGEICQLNLWGPPLRLLQSPPAPATPQLLPTDLICRVLGFLTPQDWLAADSTCRHWKRAAAACLWQSAEQRARVAAQEAARRQITRQWQRLYGFLRHTTAALHGPASQSNLQALQRAVQPFELPHDFVASLELHDGQTTAGRSGLYGMYGAFRLLGIQEILHQLSLQPRLADNDDNDNSPNSLLLPIFSVVGARQVAMELSMSSSSSDDDDDKHGRIVMVLAASTAPPLRILARSWTDFLTLV